MTGVSFFLASDTAAALISNAPSWMPLVATTITALLSAYSIATNLDQRIRIMSKLQYERNHLYQDYERLWHHWQEDDAEKVMEELLKRSREASELGALEAPYDKKLSDKWSDLVYARYSSSSA